MTSSTRQTYTAFFYGTLMAPSVLKRVTCHDPASAALPLTTRPALLLKHRRHKVRGADYPAVVPVAASEGESEGPSVRGTVVQGLTQEDIWRLDTFEGDEYARRRITVKVLPEEDGEKVPDPETARSSVMKGDSGSTHHITGSSLDAAEELPAETYIWIAGEHRLEDEEWDFDEFVREKMWRWAPSEMVEIDRAGDVDEDEGFEDVRRAVEVRDKQAPTGGRVFGGSFEGE
jgi:gamma-glutamylcyclotransferase (GGCT)/AIG2-like uncharacterized protein YtfP